MTISIREISKDDLEDYARIPMLVKVTSEFHMKKVNRGLGGIILKEIGVNEYTKDLGVYEKPLEWETELDVTNWGFFLAYDDSTPVAAGTLVFNTPGVNMLGNRKDIAVLWDIRVAPEYKSRGIGSALLSRCIRWAKQRNCKQIKIETQNTNVPACRFYAKHGAELGEINQYAYYGEEDNEFMLIWYLNLS